MNKDLLNDTRRYPKIVLWWSNKSGETELRLVDKTIKEAYNSAIAFGYCPPVWYKPWQYFTGGIGIMTVGFGESESF
jgi:hypothetical protein